MAATALMHGIIADANGLTSAGPEDFHAAAYLSRFRDPDLLESVMNQARSKQTIRMYLAETPRAFTMAAARRLPADSRFP